MVQRLEEEQAVRGLDWIWVGSFWDAQYQAWRAAATSFSAAMSISSPRFRTLIGVGFRVGQLWTKFFRGVDFHIVLRGKLQGAPLRFSASVPHS